MVGQFPARIRHRRRIKRNRECPAHRAWIRRHHCSVPGCQSTLIECAHVRVGTDGGTGLKPSDRWTVSLCRSHHSEQHEVGEKEFADRYGLDLFELAQIFARRSPHWAQLL